VLVAAAMTAAFLRDSELAPRIRGRQVIDDPVGFVRRHAFAGRRGS
jgi:hypothetical protein